MLRRAMVVPVIFAALAVAGCGSSSITVKESFGSQSISIVASGDSSTIAAEKAGAPAGSVSDGDNHSGNKICESDVTDNGRSFHVVLYSTTSLPSTTCDSFKNGING
jgi:hypothetical protein